MLNPLPTEISIPGPDWLSPSSGALVFWCECDEFLADGRRDVFMRWLTDEELARHARFVFQHSKDEFLAGRALIRGMLGSILARDPASLDFMFGPDGKPELRGIGASPHFNLSHTRGIVALALHPSLSIGVDTETIEPDRADPNLAKRFFSIHEVRHLWRFEDDAYADEFFRVWTMKEAYVKARGTGMQVPLDQFFILPARDGGRYSVQFESEAQDDAAVWQIESLRLTPKHWLAIAIKKGRRDNVPFKIAKISGL